MGQSKAPQWIHVLLAILQATLHTLGDVPSRSLAELGQRIGVAEAETAALIGLPEGPPTPADSPVAALTSAPVSPLLAMMAPSGVSSAPRLRLSRRAVRAARKKAIL
jgi:hypothetical protein